MHIVYSEKYVVDFGPHVFPTIKYKLIHDKLITKGLANEEDFVSPAAPQLDDLLLAHTQEYIDDLKNLRWTNRTLFSELPLTKEIVDEYFLFAAGTILTLKLALQKGFAFHIGGGFHHAFSEHAEGFCYINDIACGIRRLKNDNLVKRATVIDCDLHQGNGTAKIFENDPDTFTFSIHQENLYPVKQKSDLDIGLPDFAGDEEYLKYLREKIPWILDTHKPDIVVYNAGADPYKDDKLGSLQLTKEGLRQRDRIVFEECKKRQIPAGVVLAGGYAERLEDIVDIHVATCEEMILCSQQSSTNL